MYLVYFHIFGFVDYLNASPVKHGDVSNVQPGRVGDGEPLGKPSVAKSRASTSRSRILHTGRVSTVSSYTRRCQHIFTYYLFRTLEKADPSEEPAPGERESHAMRQR
ncbi:hypothetical protein ElyMa_006113200 [Elysia marginata]|uniref:Uncharacterized protein n=1 Tax=Elysia marginata TaxID=1093978 RepID=A0AAV4GWT0_9GAST|nr:hypothetical protein ElyMa_006113200 [Elysia marginata]